MLASALQIYEGSALLGKQMPVHTFPTYTHLLSHSLQCLLQIANAIDRQAGHSLRKLWTVQIRLSAPQLLPKAVHAAGAGEQCC
jgi:hypothetical protein